MDDVNEFHSEERKENLPPKTDMSSQVASGVTQDIRLRELESLLQTCQTNLEQVSRLSKIAREITIYEDFNERSKITVSRLCEQINFYHASIYINDPSGEYSQILEAAGEACDQLMQVNFKQKIGSQSLVGRVTSSGEYQVVNATANENTYVAHPLLPDTHAEIALPLLANNRILGALNIHSNHETAFTPDVIGVLLILADHIASANQNKNSSDEIQGLLSQHRLLHHLAISSATRSSLGELLIKAAQGLQAALDGDHVAILLVDRVLNRLRVAAFAGFPEEINSLEISFGDGITGWVAANNLPLLVNDVKLDTRYKSISPNVRSELAIPLTFQGELVGVLNVESDNIGAYTEDNEELLATVGVNLAAAIVNTRLQEQIRYQADRERLLFELTGKIRRASDIPGILSTMASELTKAFGASRAEINISVEESNTK
jgi:GAF domain-containing protein